MNGMTIGELAKAANVSVETVRYYQRGGFIMPEPPRGYGRIRSYGPDDVDRLRFIRAAHDLGFSLKEVEELLSLEQDRSCHAVETLAQGKFVGVRERIAGLKRIEHTLAMLVQRCETTRGRARCPIIQSLHNHTY